MINYFFKFIFFVFFGEKMGIKMRWEDFVRSMGVEF